MIPSWPRAWGDPVGSALVRTCPEDFEVAEELGFELSGDGEHTFLYLEKRQLNTMELARRLASLSGVPERQVGYSGLKDRNAVTRQWFSVGMAGRPEPDWSALEAPGEVKVLDVRRHRRKLRRGVHSANRFRLVLRALEGERAVLQSRLQTLRDAGVPNYFGEQRFGRNGSTLRQALDWMHDGRRVSRDRRSLYLSALRAYLFNNLLAQRVENGHWNVPEAGDICMLRGSRSFFDCEAVDDDILRRAQEGDLHPGLPLWGNGLPADSPWLKRVPAGHADLCGFLEARGLELAWRPARLLSDDFSWQFCDDDTLQLDFALGAGNYATALLAEFVHHKENWKQKYKDKQGLIKGGRGSEQT